MNLIYSKTVDKSVLSDGFSIRSIYLKAVTDITGQLAIGERRQIKFLFNNTIYDGIELKNQAFSREKYPTHKEMYQVRYSPNSEFSKALRGIYNDVWQYIEQQRAIMEEHVRQGGKRYNIKLPDSLNRTIAFFASDVRDVWIVEAYNAADQEALENSIRETDELDYERIDNTAKIVEKVKKIKLRVLDRKVGDTLKQMYEFKCQVCGESVGHPYGNDRIADAHHIDPFTHSFNNNFNNIMILCPTHHRIIHHCHGEYKPTQKEIWYPNGLHEPLTLNLHL